MSNLNFNEKTKLERILEMGDGYVLNFSNRTFQEFVSDSTGLDIYAEKYEYASSSKANRLRAFWSREPNHVVGKLIADLLDYCGDYGNTSNKQSLYEDCRRIAERLQQDAPVQELEAISPNSGGREFEMLTKSVEECIKKNEPETGLDRLHTFVVKYVRVLCEKHGIDTGREKSLHSLFGDYVRYFKTRGLIQSEMTERILKSSISILAAFNKVRNEHSFAHDNSILDHNESLLIFNQISSVIRFVRNLEEYSGQRAQTLVEGE